jgi:putative RNA 2'-phosphotransferase
LAKRTHQFKVYNLSRVLLYILGHRPDEFGLVPDSQGFLTYRELLQAIHEEADWHYVRQSHVNEVLLGKDRSLFQPEEKRIRAVERKWRLDIDHPVRSVPKILFTAVRRKAHPVVMEKGLKSAEGRYIVLTPDEGVALRIGKRRDQKPVLLEVLAATAESKGVSFYAFGNLILSSRIPGQFIAGPPVSRDVLESRRHTEATKEKEVAVPVDFSAGTFLLNSLKDPDLRRRAKGKKRKGWKEESRKIRKGKRR